MVSTASLMSTFARSVWKRKNVGLRWGYLHRHKHLNKFLFQQNDKIFTVHNTWETYERQTMLSSSTSDSAVPIRCWRRSSTDTKIYRSHGICLDNTHANLRAIQTTLIGEGEGGFQGGKDQLVHARKRLKVPIQNHCESTIHRPLHNRRIHRNCPIEHLRIRDRIACNTIDWRNALLRGGIEWFNVKCTLGALELHVPVTFWKFEMTGMTTDSPQCCCQHIVVLLHWNHLFPIIKLTIAW